MRMFTGLGVRVSESEAIIKLSWRYKQEGGADIQKSFYRCQTENIRTGEMTKGGLYNIV